MQDNQMDIVSWELEGHKNFVDVSQVAMVFAQEGQLCIFLNCGQCISISFDDREGAKRIENRIWQSKLENKGGNQKLVP